ncbi:hypothetical protein [Microbacterium aurantiacum]|uniref:hypothetical protein n=1 Tax=Microbacterium aurantiacum TaxID=162393 RepID=UPI003D71F330
MKVAILTTLTDELVHFELTPADSDTINGDQVIVEVIDHDPVETLWRATLPVIREDDGVWRGAMDLDPFDSERRIFEIRRLTLPTAEGDGAVPVASPEVHLDDDSRLHAEPETPGTWASGNTAQAELDARLAQRAALRTQVLTVPGATGAKIYSCVMVVTGLLISQIQQVQGIEVRPLAVSTIGTDVETVLNDILPQLGHGVQMPKGEWLKLQDKQHAAILHIRNIGADDAESAARLADRAANDLLDLLALRRGARGVVLGGALLHTSENGTQIRPMRVGPGYHGNLAVGVISGEDTRTLLALWSASQADGRARLWLSMRADALRDSRADYRFFGMFNLLEAIAHELLPDTHPVVDDAGQPFVMSTGKRGPVNYTMKQARGAVWALAQHVSRAFPTSLSSYSSRRYVPDPSKPGGLKEVDGDLWKDLKLWVDVRNLVAHEGTIRSPSGTPLVGKRGDLGAELKALANPPGDAEVGFWLLSRNIEALTHDTLNAYLRGLL